MNAEPKEDKTQSADKIWLDKIHNWAEKCTPATREILMAEKRANFVTSFTAPSDKKEPAWHAGYYLTRMLMVEALRGTNEALYQHLREWAVKGISLQVQKIANADGKSIKEAFDGLVKEHLLDTKATFTGADKPLWDGRVGITRNVHKRLNYLQQAELTAQQKPAQAATPQKIVAAETSTTIESKTLSLDEVAALGKETPIKPVSQKSTQKPLDMTNKSVFTYVYGKGVVR